MFLNMKCTNNTIGSEYLLSFRRAYYIFFKYRPYHAGIMLDAFGYLLCFKLCWHNRPVPSYVFETTYYAFEQCPKISTNMPQLCSVRPYYAPNMLLENCILTTLLEYLRLSSIMSA